MRRTNNDIALRLRKYAMHYMHTFFTKGYATQVWEKLHENKYIGTHEIVILFGQLYAYAIRRDDQELIIKLYNENLELLKLHQETGSSGLKEGIETLIELETYRNIKKFRGSEI